MLVEELGQLEDGLREVLILVVEVDVGAVTAVVVATRVAWFFTTPYLVWAIDPKSAASDQRAGALAAAP
jgi:hypothetical protein